MKSPTDKPEANRLNEEKRVSVVYLDDPTSVGDSVEVIDQDVVNLDKIDFAAKRITVPFVDCCLLFHSVISRLRTRTKVHDDFDNYTTLGPDAHGRVNGMELGPFWLLTASRGEQGEIIVERGYESVGILVPPDVLEKHLVTRGRFTDFELTKGTEIRHPDIESARRNFELGMKIADAAESAPEVFDDSHWTRYGAQVEFVDSLLATIESCKADENVAVDKKGKSYSKIVRTCEDFTLSLDGRRPYLSELCAAAHVSERTLQYAFHDIMGMSPLTYLIRLRLHRARDELQKASGDSTTVTSVALNWGFWHFGEFSRAYKRENRGTLHEWVHATNADGLLKHPDFSDA